VSAVGRHNERLDVSRSRLIKSRTYQDLSTVCIIPTRGVISAHVVNNWFGLMTPMNQKFHRVIVEGMEVGEAYSTAISQILASAELSTWKYILTVEEDNTHPPDGLLKLLESIEGKVDGNKYSAVGGLYWTKGEGGQPMIYGNPNELPLNFRPQLPIPDSVQRCNGLGMGFTLFRMEMFKDQRLRTPWFKTEQSYIPGVGARAFTQDLYFFEDAGKWGHTFACDTRVLVGHYDLSSGVTW